MSQCLGNVGSEIRKDEGCSRTLDSTEMLERNRIAVDPSPFRCRLHHGVLATHVIRPDRHSDSSPYRGDDVEVGKGRFHHDHVGTLGDVESHFLKRFKAVSGILLVRPPVTPTYDG